MSEDQLQPEDTLLDRGVDDVLDEGYSPPDRPRGSNDKSVTALGELEGETLDERIAQEEPEVWAADEEAAELGPDAIIDGPVGGEVGAARAGRLISPDSGSGEDDEAELLGFDVGIDGAAASAEEAAMHVIEEE
ncbi:DUF5709 domain-containing protein [Nocardioides sp. Bht2]|uniref:DUF5709 domain-containing protein n=1 Tax=Nocardioides sp. Bht2 TaxID=3392297 RepID=UPI0039B4BF68